MHSLLVDFAVCGEGGGGGGGGGVVLPLIILVTGATQSQPLELNMDFDNNFSKFKI